MKKKLLTKLGSGLLITSLLLSTTACSNASNKANGNSKSSDQLIFYTESSTYEGEVSGYVGKALEEKIGVSINVVPNSVGGTSRFETKLTTGDLGDIILFTSQEDLQKAIKAGVIEDLSEEIDNMENVKRFKEAVDRSSNMFDGLFAIASTVDLKSTITKTDPSIVPSMRFDYYEELGNPVISDFWDYYDVIEKMVKDHPKTEDGHTFYGLSLFSEWDGTSVNQIRGIAKTMGYSSTDGVNNFNFVNAGATEDKIEDILQENSTYLQGLKWANKFYQNGMLDPDSASQTWEDYLAKAEKGQSAIWLFGYMGDLNFNPKHTDLLAEGKGYKRIPFSTLKAVDAKTSTVGNNWFMAVSSKSKNKEKAIELLDYLYSDEGQMMFENGPQGVLWDINDEGKPYLTDLGKGYDDEKIPEEYGGGVKGDTLKKLINAPAIDQNAVNPNLGEPANRQVWESTLVDGQTELDKKWTETYDGALNVKEYLIKNDQLAAYSIVDVPVLKYDDKLEVIRNQVGEIIKEYSWQMIYAKDESTFSSLKKEMIKKAKNLGYDDCVALEKAAAEKWFELRKSVE